MVRKLFVGGLVVGLIGSYQVIAYDFTQFQDFSNATQMVNSNITFMATDYRNRPSQQENLVYIEAILRDYVGLSLPHNTVQNLDQIDLSDKKRLLSDWARRWNELTRWAGPEAGPYSANYIHNFAEYLSHMNAMYKFINPMSSFFFSNQSYFNNLVYLENFNQNVLSIEDAKLLNMSREDKENSVRLALRVPTLVPAPAPDWADADGEESKSDTGYLATKRGTSLANHFAAAVGINWADARISRRKNGVDHREAPRLNKYNQGNFSANLITLESPYVIFKSQVPFSIRSAVAGIPDSGVKLYVEIDAQPGWENKGRRVNLIFHGAMIDWYKGEAPGAFNFDGAFAKDLPMGVFDLNGATPVDLAVGTLKPLNVNAHNQLYSPDNAGFIANADRHIVTFWSVAKSDEKKRAVVTFHILFDWDLPNAFKEKVLDLSYRSQTLGGLIRGLKGLAGSISSEADRTAWENGIRVLEGLYSSV